MDYTYLNVDIQGHIAYCTITNPPRHTITDAGLKELRDLLRSLEQDDSVRILVFTGADEKIFIAHYEVGELADISEQQPAPEEASKPKLYLMNRLFLAFENSRLITIAALNGAAGGGGWELALACDFRLAKTGKHKFGLPETNVGIIPGSGGTQRMARLLGTAKALDYILHGTHFTPEEAFDMGLVHRLYSASDFKDSVRNFAEVLASRSPIALSQAKKAIQSGVQKADMKEALLLEQECFDTAMRSEDASGAMRAWLNGKSYQWKGK